MKRDRVVIPEGAPLVKPASARRALDAGVAGGGMVRIMGMGPQRSYGPWSRSPVSWTAVGSVLYCPGHPAGDVDSGDLGGALAAARRAVRP